MKLTTLTPVAPALPDLPTSVGVLIRMAAILEKPSGWCKGADAKTMSGKAVPYHSPEATSWSLSGALMLSAFTGWQGNGQPVYYQLRGFFEMSESMNLDGINDDPAFNHDDVLALLNRAMHFFVFIEEYGGMSKFLNEKPAPETN